MKTPLRVLSVNKGQGISPDHLLPTLLKDLQDTLGEPISQRFKTKPSSKLTSRVFAVALMKGSVIKKLLSDLDFSVVKIDSSGYIGGTRIESTGQRTIVNYCAYSGVLVVSTNLDSPKT